MGIKAFTKFLRDKFPQHLNTIHISEFTQKKIGIEAHLFLYKFKCAEFSTGNSALRKQKRKNEWKTQIMYFILSFRKFNVHPVIILEGSAPSSKSQTVQDRIDAREKVKKRLQLLTILRSCIMHKREIDKTLISELISTGQNMSIFPELHKKLSGSSIDTSDDEMDLKKMTKRDILLSKHPSLKIIDEELEKLEKRTISVTQEDVETLKTICHGIGVNYIQSPCEAEAYLCRLLKAGKIDAVMTEDSDVCAYGCDNWLTKYTYKQYNEDGITNTLLKISTIEICEEMEITADNFIDLCVLCGTDYCENIKGLGPVKLLKIIKEDPNYKKRLWNDEFEAAKQIFLNQGVQDEYHDVEWCVIPSSQKIQKMLTAIECKDSPEKILSFIRTKVIIEE